MNHDITVMTEMTENMVQMSIFDMFDQVNDVAQLVDLDGSRRLFFAIFAQAVKDAASRDRTKNKQELRQEARAWLLEHGAAYLETLGIADLQYSQKKLELWIREGCILPVPGRGRA